MTLPAVNSIYIDALKLSRQERNAYWNVLSMLEQRTSGPYIVFLDILMHFKKICKLRAN
jgi:hypothetical protein